MPMLSLFRRCRPVVLAVVWCLGAVAAQAGVIVNGGFEGGISPWSIPSGGAAAAASPVRSGTGSMQLTATNTDAVAFQTFAASPGQTWDLSGYLLAPDPLPSLSPGAYFGLLKIVFRDGTDDLEPATVNIGNAGASAFPGVESVLFDASSAEDQWHFLQAQGVAPVGTTEVRLFALLVSRGSDQVTSTLYVDDVQAHVVPEPTPLALLAGAGLALFVARRRVA